jgi:exonuclease SbcC
MKILRVRFFNLNSLRGRHELDFSQPPLRDAGLFAITGPTGAGKTTILDAITLALYGQVPRHDGGVEQVMTQGTGESWAEVEFMVNGHTYRSKWSQHRARKSAEGQLQDSKMELSQRPADADETVDKWPFLETYKSKVPPRVAELSGLEYKQFLRSVLLAQGDFTKFLKSSPGERAQLLEKITDTRTYSDISRAAFEKAKLEDQRTAELRTGLAGVRLLSEEELAGLQATAQELSEQVAAATAEQQRTSQAHGWRQQLAELTSRQQRSLQRLQELATETEQLVPLRQRIERHQQALPFRTPWEMLRRADQQQADLQLEIKRLQEQLPQLREAVAQARQARQQATAAHAQAVATRREQEPQLAAAEKLDAQITSAEQTLTAGRQEYDRRNELCKKLKASTEAAQQQQRELQRQLGETSSWLRQNQQAADFGEALGSLAGSLQDWERLRGELGELLTQEQARRQRLGIALDAARQGQFVADRTAQEIRECQAEQATAAQARQTWTRHLQQHQLYLQQAYAEQERSWQDVRRLIQTQRLILHHEAARQHLATGEPCPLCGATEHPFATGGLYVSAATVSDDERREQLLEQQLQHLTTRLTQTVSLLGALEPEPEAALVDYSALALGAEAEAAAPATIRGLLQQLRGFEQHLSQLQLQLGQAATAVKTATDQQIELNREIADIQQRLADAREREPLVREQIASICASFGLQFSGENGPALVEQLRHLGAEYQHRQKAATDTERELAVLAQRQASDLPALAEQQAWLKANKTGLLEQHQAIQQQKDERQRLFAGADIAGARRQLLAAEDAAEQQRQAAEQQARTHETTADRAEQHLVQREQDLRQLVQTRDTQYQKLIDNLQAAKLPPVPTALAERLLPDDVAQRLGQQLSRHDQQLAAAQQTLTDVAQQLRTEEGRALSTEPLEVLAEELRQSTQRLADLNQQLGQCQQQLRSHAQAQQQHAALAAQVEQQQREALRWRKLADLIGSADGRKFSEFAQGLTLARLVELANRHLRRLNERYRISRHPHEHLDLLIIDTFQADATRSMSSLSGGESFLVSLALALGLSELAGRKTQIDTLFIDEGFGTLDPDTLEVALAALEQLQGTGKTIGIISHVEALKERISTKIEVRRGAGGLSTLIVT